MLLDFDYCFQKVVLKSSAKILGDTCILIGVCLLRWEVFCINTCGFGEPTLYPLWTFLVLSCVMMF